MKKLILLFLICFSAYAGIFSKNDLKEINIISQVEANNNNLAKLDVVFIFDNDIFNYLPKKSEEWFYSKDILLTSFEEKIKVISLEVPPSSILQKITLTSKHQKAFKVLVYSSYTSLETISMCEITNFKIAQIELLEKEFNCKENK